MDGSLEPIDVTGTNDCTNVARSNGTHPSARMRCPAALPYMCKERYHGDTDEMYSGSGRVCCVWRFAILWYVAVRHHWSAGL